MYTDSSNYEKFTVQTNPTSSRLYITYDKARAGTARTWWIQNNSDLGFNIYGGNVAILKSGTFGTVYTFGPDNAPYQFTLSSPAAATNVVPQPSPQIVLQGDYWTGSASATDAWTVVNQPGAGANAPSALLFTHAGTTGGAYVDFTGATAVLAATLALKSATGPTISSGSGSPEGSVIAPVGSLYTNILGGAGTTLYVKESGTGATGWAGK